VWEAKEEGDCHGGLVVLEKEKQKEQKKASEVEMEGKNSNGIARLD